MKLYIGFFQNINVFQKSYSEKLLW